MAGRMKPWGETPRWDAVRGFLLGGFIAVGGYVHNMHASGWGSDGFSPIGFVLLVLLSTAAGVVGGWLIRQFPEHYRRLKAPRSPTGGRVTSQLRAEGIRLTARWRGLGQRWRARR
jgi:hypothetical protein